MALLPDHEGGIGGRYRVLVRETNFMSTLKEDLQNLLTVQEIDTRIDRIKTALAAVDTGNDLAARFNTGKIAFERQKAEAVKAQATQKDVELALQTIEAKIAKVNGDLYGGTITAARELKNLQSEVEMLERQKTEAESKVRGAMETAKFFFDAAQKAESGLRTLADHYKQVRGDYKQKHAELSAELVAQEKERAKAIKPIGAIALARYDTVRAKRKGIGVALLPPDGSCGVCHTHLNSALVNAVRAAETIQTCEYCGRILVPPV